MKILLVYDNDEFRSILIDFLIDNGHSIEPFTEPSLAIHCLEFKGNQFDCIITDYNMPGIDEFATEAKKLRDVPIFMCINPNRLSHVIALRTLQKYTF